MSSTYYMMAWMPGPWELVVIAMFGLLIFGKRLPEVGKSLGKSIVEFKKGLKGIEDEVDRAVERDQRDMLPPPSPPPSSGGDQVSSHQGSGTNSQDPVSHAS